MKHIVFFLALAVAAIGCRAQVPPNPTSYNCPSSSGSNYTPLNPSSPASGLTYTDTPTTAGHYCYIAQSVITSTGQISTPSNTAGPLNITTLTGAKSVALSWNAPTTGPTPDGYVLSRAPAISSTVIAPNLGGGSVAEIQQAPQLQPKGDVVPATQLVASVRQYESHH